MFYTAHKATIKNGQLHFEPSEGLVGLHLAETVEDKSGEANPSAATLTPPSSGGDNQGNGRDSGPRQ